MMNYKIPLAISLLTFAACQKSGETILITNDRVLSKISVVATSDLNPPKKMVGATIAPKPGFMSWTSHILLLSQDGEVYATNTGFSGFTKVADGPFTDIHGLSLGDSPSIFLALNGNGGLKAYQELDDGGFQELAISTSEFSGLSFCAMETPSSENFFVSHSGGVFKHAFDVKDGALLEISNPELAYDKVVTNCKIDRRKQLWKQQSDSSLSGQNLDGRAISLSEVADFSKVSSGDNSGLMVVSSDSGTASFVTDNVQYQLNIEPGLSIMGIEKADWVLSTNVTMGNTFSEGLTLVSDKNSSRIVMIANDYLLEKVLSDTNPTAQ